VSKRNLVGRVLVSAILILVGMLVSWLFLTGGAGQFLSLAGPSSAQAAANTASTAMQRDPAAPEVPTVWHTCTSVGVAVYSNRIHVECNVAASGIRFFALSTSNPHHTARILSVLSMAHVTGKQLTIEYNPTDTSGTAIGCLASDCRLIQSAAILP
jgi:hypothetical protein